MSNLKIQGTKASCSLPTPMLIRYVFMVACPGTVCKHAVVTMQKKYTLLLPFSCRPKFPFGDPNLLDFQTTERIFSQWPNRWSMNGLCL